MFANFYRTHTEFILGLPWTCQPQVVLHTDRQTDDRQTDRVETCVQLLSTADRRRRCCQTGTAPHWSHTSHKWSLYSDRPYNIQQPTTLQDINININIIINPLMPTVVIRLQLLSILCQTGLSRHL